MSLGEDKIGERELTDEQIRMKRHMLEQAEFRLMELKIQENQFETMIKLELPMKRARIELNKIMDEIRRLEKNELPVLQKQIKNKKESYLK